RRRARGGTPGTHSARRRRGQDRRPRGRRARGARAPRAQPRHVDRARRYAQVLQAAGSEPSCRTAPEPGVGAMSLWIDVAIFGLCLAGAAVFAGGETAFYRISRVRIEMEARQGKSTARLARALLSDE